MHNDGRRRARSQEGAFDDHVDAADDDYDAGDDYFVALAGFSQLKSHLCLFSTAGGSGSKDCTLALWPGSKPIVLTPFSGPQSLPR